MLGAAVRRRAWGGRRTVLCDGPAVELRQWATITLPRPSNGLMKNDPKKKNPLLKYKQPSCQSGLCSTTY